mmetsp:Transcript_2151/g.5616  ORF Transcript_2151/g.5616 Transcript_2151/m.5616 type:complete len:308 (-) Transcript_2151:51-974(-)
MDAIARRVRAGTRAHCAAAARAGGLSTLRACHLRLRARPLRSARGACGAAAAAARGRRRRGGGGSTRLDGPAPGCAGRPRGGCGAAARTRTARSAHAHGQAQRERAACGGALRSPRPRFAPPCRARRRGRRRLPRPNSARGGCGGRARTDGGVAAPLLAAQGRRGRARQLQAHQRRAGGSASIADGRRRHGDGRRPAAARAPGPRALALATGGGGQQRRRAAAAAAHGGRRREAPRGAVRDDSPRHVRARRAQRRWGCAGAHTRRHASRRACRRRVRGRRGHVLADLGAVLRSGRETVVGKPAQACI